MTYKVVFHHLLPCLNDYIGAAHQLYHYRGSSRSYGDALMKKREQRILEMEIRRQLKGVHIKRPVRITLSAFEDTRKRDWGNVLAVIDKFCLDALVSAGVLQNDSQRWVADYGKPILGHDKQNPRIEIIIDELEEE